MLTVGFLNRTNLSKGVFPIGLHEWQALQNAIRQVTFSNSLPSSDKKNVTLMPASVGGQLAAAHENQALQREATTSVALSVR